MHDFLHTLADGFLVIIGGVLTPLTTHFYENKRERRNNIKDMRGALGRIAGMIEIASKEEVGAKLTENMVHIRGYCLKYYSDFRFWRRKAIKSVCDELAEAAKNGSKKQILDKIGELNALI